MIVDDRHLVIGSANVNDRSMLGSRDSELAVCIEGPSNVKVAGASGDYMVTKKIHDFRVNLFREHFGMDIEFPANPHSWTVMWHIARTNTEIFSKVFKIYPDDAYPSWMSLQTRDKKFDQNAFDELTPKIQGHAVVYPYKFLLNENLLDGKNSELSLMVVPIYALF